jgi:hypothetical protein
MIIFYIIGIIYLLFLAFSYYWYFEQGNISQCTTPTSRFIFRHAEISILLIVLFVVLTLASAAGYILATNITQGW